MAETATPMPEFDAVIQSPPDAPKAAYIHVPFDVKEVFGTRARVAVKGTFDNREYRGTIQPMTGGHVIGLSAGMRKALGKTTGDTIHVTMEMDSEERAVEIPADLSTALDSRPAARDHFNKLPYSHQKEYVEHITEAKKPETRARRVEKTVETLARAPLER
ncbi:YdeI/OmpD-associated family protein [Dehalogenimonas sp. 4OHTPN]|uniref:YdeI/OmpD-associated family protein n=1 Tax=Dehalogenimonas sp. 4OHTPN TaxID=3166643 RepID=A0AAU8GBW5_9CHLR